VKKIHFKFLRVFRRKNNQKREENTRNRSQGAASGAMCLHLCTLRLVKVWGSILLLSQALCAWYRVKSHFFLVFQAESAKKA
jgi:hypothetical protein